MTDVDWAVLARRFSQIQAHMLHRESGDLRGDAFYAEALRRLLATPASGFITLDEHEHTLDLNRKVDRANGDRAQRTLAELTRQHQAKMRDSAQLHAKALRAWCNERTVPSRLRREGVLLAAHWLDPQGEGTEHALNEGSHR